MRVVRWTLTVAALVATLIMGAVTLTAPMIAAEGPAILTVALAVATWVAWPKRRKA